MFTEKGQEVFRRLQNAHRFDYLDRNPGCNENDIERNFLNRIMMNISLDDYKFNEMLKLIDEIR